ncbi:MAG: CRTAC1 family protein [Gemmatimonadota bacterium]
MTRPATTAVSGLCLSLVSVSLAVAQPAGPVVFTDVTAESGIRFEHSFGDREMSSILEATGSGCLFFDYDGDGRLDLYAVNGAYLAGISNPEEEPAAPYTNRLYRNLGGGRFADVTAGSGAGDPGYGMAGVAGDYDNDGRPDLFVTNYGRNTLYRNGADATFTDVTAAASVGDTLWGVGATFLDYDRDGDLDLFVGNYLEFDPGYQLYYAADNFPGPLSYPGQPDVLYRNEGNGTFADVTAAAGVANRGRAMGVAAADYDGDGWTDLFVANDAMANYLYHNRGNGAFEDVGLLSGVAFSSSGDKSSSMGGDFGDFDHDGDLDLFVPDMAYNNFYVQLDGTRFDDATAALGIAEASGQYVSWSGNFLDYDNDGWADLFISNGDAHHLEHTQEALLLANRAAPDGRRVFADVSGGAGPFFYHRCVSRGAAAADYDDDGDLDLFVVHLDQPSMLLRNDGGNARHWVQVALRGSRSNREGYGARVRLRAGDLVQVAEKLNAAGYLSQGDPRLHFGLGEATAVDTLQVRWPSGATQELTGIVADQVVSLQEPTP